MKKLPEDIHRVLDETYYQRLKKPIRTIELPCTKNHKWREPVRVQLDRVGDQKITCPLCGKEHYLIWSKVQDNLRYA